MDDSEVTKKQKRAKKVNRKRKSMTSRSNILKKIIESLEKGQYRHMLYWHDRLNKEFIIKFVHMNNKEFKEADYLALFRDLDRLSNKYEKYSKEEKYDHNCKVRCKSNLKKLCGKDNNKALTLVDKPSKGKSIQLRKYKLNDDSMLGVNNPLKGGNMTKRRNVNGFSERETVHRLPHIKGKLKIENLPNEQSHCLCLSKLNSINVYIRMPTGAKSTSSASPVGYTYYTTENGNKDAILIDPWAASPVGPTMLGTYCATESRNENVKNTIPQIVPLTVYEHEKQMDEKVVALPTMSIENSALYGFGSCSSIEEKDKCESMEYSELLAPKMQSNAAIQHAVALPPMSVENTVLYGVGSSSIEENDKCESMEYSELLAPKIQRSAAIPNIEEFQNSDFETKNLSQLVPSSPLDVNGISNDPFCEYYMDYRPDIDKPLQRDNDPFLSSTSTDCLGTDLSERNCYLPLDTELQDWYSLENLKAIDVD